MASTIVLATPHARHDRLEGQLRKRLPDHDVIRLRAKQDVSVQNLERIAPAMIFFPHWSWRIPDEVHARYECVVFHMTDLPYGRGGSPLQNLIVRGHQQTVMSALRCTGEIDAGPIYLKRPLSLDGTAEDILQRAADEMALMIEDIVRRRPEPVPQQGEVVRFERRRPEDGNLASATELRQVFDLIRMLDADGYPRAFVETAHLRLEFSEARLDDDSVEARVRIVARR